MNKYNIAESKQYAVWNDSVNGLKEYINRRCRDIGKKMAEAK